MGFKNKDFVHLHCHSEFSQFDGLAKVPDLVMQARKMGFKAIALTDHGNVMGLINFIKECEKTQDKSGTKIPYPTIKPILGMEAYIARQMDIGQYDKKRRPKDIQYDGRKGNKHLNLYAMNWKGYKNLCTLSQRAWTKGFYSDPRIDIELLSKHSEGLMGGSACLKGLINENLLHGKYERAKRVCGILKDVFNNNFFLEIMYHGIPEEKAIVPEIFKLSKEMNVPICATNDVHYIKKEYGKSQEILMCMASSTCVNDPKHIKHRYNEFYLKSAEDMGRIFDKHPEVIYNTVKIADKIDTEDIKRHLFGGMRLPKFTIPDEYNDSYEYMEKLAWDGLKRLGWEGSEEHVKALKKELRDVKVARDNNNYDFAKYFLIVKDYIDAAKDIGALVGPGRGSGYASILLRCLNITYGVDPIQYDLIWERFLGFDDIRFIKESDFGFEDTTTVNNNNLYEN
ncbi:MAG: PHP domain-containing protein [bacterium]